MRPWALLRQRRGLTMVELVVCAGLLSMLIGLTAAAVGPFIEMFTRLQGLNHAQSIADTVLEDISGQLLDAQEYVKLYPEDAVFGDGAMDAGAAVEYKNADGFAVLLDAGGCGETRVVKNAASADSGQSHAYEPGYLLMRYYRVADGNIYYYKDEQGDLIARALTQVYGTRFYMGYTVELEFRYPEGTAEGEPVDALEVSVSVYKKGEFVYRDGKVADLAFTPRAKTGRTAEIQPGAES